MVLSLVAVAPVAVASKGPGHHGKPVGGAKGPSGAAGPTGGKGPSGASGPSANGKAYGYYCQSQSRKHVPGQKGTPFSQCVTAMAKLASGKATSPQAACAALSKTHVPGERGTPFSRCVAAGAKLLKNRHG